MDLTLYFDYATSGCSVCLDEEPFKDEVNKDMSFIIRGNIMYVLQDGEYDDKSENDFRMCETVASFVLNKCPVCGRDLAPSMNLVTET